MVLHRVPPAAAQPADVGSYTADCAAGGVSGGAAGESQDHRDWIDMNDYASALLSHTTGVGAGAVVRPAQQRRQAQGTGGGAGKACDKAATVLRTKNADDSKKAIQECEDAVAALTKAASGEKAVHKNFQARSGNTQTWMMLMDCSVVDAKDTNRSRSFNTSRWPSRKSERDEFPAQRCQVAQTIRGDALRGVKRPRRRRERRPRRGPRRVQEDWRILVPRAIRDTNVNASAHDSGFPSRAS